VVVINAAKVRVTGKKVEDKVYRHHTNYPGGLRSIAFGDMLARHPTRPIEIAVKGMLPHNSRGRAMVRRLKVYAEGTHPHEAQVKGTTEASSG
jgi:large subunit ribosomal protein L13